MVNETIIYPPDTEAIEITTLSEAKWAHRGKGLKNSFLSLLQ